MTGFDVLLVGSIPLEDSGAVFDAVDRHLHDRVRRVPDGETGPRTNWIAWQRQVFDVAGLEPAEEPEREYQLGPPFRLAADAVPTAITLGPPGFADEALRSYELFAKRRSAGAFGEATRFQVSLPTPFAPLYSFVAYSAQGLLYEMYEAAMLDDLAEICEAIPHHDLAVQWDVATEMSIFESLHPVPYLGDAPQGWLLDRLAMLGDHVPDNVELGFHLCYGSMNNKHWKEPVDLGVCAQVANGIGARIARPVTWVHMPVPVDRDDDAYFAPLADLDLAEATTVFLGLIHDADGVEGVERRVAAARRHTALPFGVATECGLGRRAAGEVADILTLHAALID